MQINPFYYGNPVSPEHFLGRQKELRRIVSRMLGCQSTAIIGEPRSGKTSLLLYLVAPENRKALYGEQNEKQFFSFLDILTLGEQVDQAKFWELALHPLHEKIILPNPDSQLAGLYQACRDNGFHSQVLEYFLRQAEKDGYRLVLLLDEFDMLLNHPLLNSMKFFGSLRSLASRIRALSVVAASRQPLTKLNAATQEFNRTGSPVFNFLGEYTLGAWSEKTIDKLLERAGKRFSVEDKRFIKHAAGAHPYLLQAAAAALWEIYEDGEEEEPAQRLEQAGQQLYDVAGQMLGDTWRIWSPQIRLAMSAVALAQTPDLLEERKFRDEVLAGDMRNFGPELRILVKQGFVEKAENSLSGWRIRPAAFLWWLADELVRTVRDEQAFAEWIRAQEWDGLLTIGEKEKFSRAGKAVAGLLSNGASELIKAAIKKI